MPDASQRAAGVAVPHGMTLGGASQRCLVASRREWVNRFLLVASRQHPYRSDWLASLEAWRADREH